MNRTWIRVLSMLVVLSFTASVAYAGTHINRITFTASGGTTTSLMTAARASSPSSTCAAPCSGLMLNAAGVLAGLGQENATVDLTAEGLPVTTCTNQGGNQAPGQNPPKIAVNGKQAIGSDQIAKNGRADLDVTSEPPPTLPGSQGGCPNDNWTATIESIRFTSATITITQGGEVTLNQSFTFP